jgi:hypothetical protein
MDPIYTWLDPVAVRQLADSLLQPNRANAQPSTHGGFDDGFIGFEADSDSLEIAPAVAVVSGLIPATTVEQAISAESFAVKVERFSRWMRQQFATTGLFILDREGAVIFDEGGQEYLHFLARSMAISPCRLGNVHVKISAAAVLEIIPIGAHVLGAVVSDALTPASAAEILKEFSVLA